MVGAERDIRALIEIAPQIGLWKNHIGIGRSMGHGSGAEGAWRDAKEWRDVRLDSKRWLTPKELPQQVQIDRLRPDEITSRCR